MLFFVSHCFCSLVFIGFSSVFLWFSCFVRWFSFVVQRFLWFFASFTHVSVALFWCPMFFHYFSWIFIGFNLFFFDFSCGVCKNPEPFPIFFPEVIVFFLLSFFQALASRLDERIHMSEEREKEKE